MQARVVLSRMNEPLGTTAGNSLEVLESVQCLAGTMSPDIRQLVSILGVLYQLVLSVQFVPKQWVSRYMLVSRGKDSQFKHL